MSFAPPLSFIGSRLLDKLFPPQCMSCGERVKSHGTMCQACWQNLHFITDPMCAHCGYPFAYGLGEGALCAGCIDVLPEYDRGYSAFIFDDTSKSLLHKLKFEDQGYLAHIFAEWLAVHMPSSDYDMIIPVPLSRKRLYKRRYNQSALVAKELAERLHVAYRPQWLKRIKHTTPQTGLTQIQRQENVKDAFAVSCPSSSLLMGKTVLLLDDVMTTGATITACTRVLKKAGVSVVHVVTLARVIQTQ